MSKRNAASRRNFIKTGFALTGAGMIPGVDVRAGACDPDTIKAPGPIPLNDLLVNIDEATKNGSGLVKAKICSEADWDRKRVSILRRSKMIMGDPPAISAGPLRPEVLGEEQRNGYREIKVRFASGTGDVIKGYLLVPDGTTASSPRPAIMALHSTGPGASQAVGLTPKEGREYGRELAQRGYVVLATDTITAGERVYPGYEAYYTKAFFLEFPLWSAMGKMIHDHQRGLDYLCSLDYVDPQRLGCIGHSLGGYNSFFLQAFDARIKAAVSSCGLSTMGGTCSPYKWVRSDWFVHFNPACRDYLQAGMVPCDVHEIMALSAPRPFFNYSAREDAIYHPEVAQQGQGFAPWWQTIDKALSQVSAVYDVLGKRDHFVRVETDGGHDFPHDVREKAYRWLDSWLKA